MAREQIEALLNAGLQAARSGKKVEARRLFEQVLELEDDNERAWLALASVVDTPRERRICLENVLEINPNNERARQALERMQVSSETAPRPTAPSNPTTPTVGTPARPTSSPPRTAAGRSAAAQRATAEPPTRASREAWQRQSATGSNLPIPPVLILIVVAALALLFIGASLIFNPSTPEGTPTVAEAADAANVTPTISVQDQLRTQFPDGTPTPTPRGTVIAGGSIINDLPPTWTPSPTPSPLPSRTPTPEPPPVTDYRLLFVRDTAEGTAIFTANGDGSQPRRIADGSDAAWSRDGNQIVYISQVEGVPQLTIANADGSDPRVITTMSGTRMHSPAWSPAGTDRIAFVSNQEQGTDDIYIINVDGTNLFRATVNRFADIDPAWSPDGEKLVYASDQTGRDFFQIQELDLQSFAVSELTNTSGRKSSPNYSPDGLFIAFVSTSARSEVFVMRADGTGETMLTFGDGDAENRDPAWSPDGRYIAFTSTRDEGIFNIFLMQPDGRNVQQITDANSATLHPRFRPVQ